jgi:hypothetical protein
MVPVEGWMTASTAVDTWRLVLVSAHLHGAPDPIPIVLMVVARTVQNPPAVLQTCGTFNAGAGAEWCLIGHWWGHGLMCRSPATLGYTVGAVMCVLRS